MGARGRVQVETLVAENSVEETMAEYEQSTFHRSDDRTAVEMSSSKEYLAAKTHALLRSLRYMTNFQSFHASNSQIQGTVHNVPSTVKQEDSSTTVPSPVSRLQDLNEKWNRSYNCHERWSGNDRDTSSLGKGLSERRHVTFEKPKSESHVKLDRIKSEET